MTDTDRLYCTCTEDRCGCRSVCRCPEGCGCERCADLLAGWRPWKPPMSHFVPSNEDEKLKEDVPF